MTAAPTPAPADEQHLTRALKNRHIQLIAIGGAIGTGLFYGASDGRLRGRVQVHPDAPVTSLAVYATRRTLWAALGAGGGKLVHVPL